MSEEMDKKSGTRPSSVPQKTNGNESKNKNENGTQRPCQKYGKKKDYVGNRSYQDNNSPRKPTPQKTKTSVDKRPRSRGNYGGYRQRDDVVEEYRGDFESALNSGSKKVNLNHLLNFSYADRESYSDRPRGSGYRGRGNRRWSSRITYNKEQFLQANCQFIVKEEGDYTVHNIDPDILVDWNAIELIKVNSHELPSCPICLEHPRAAKITRCGHIYCWACILHYLTLGEKTWRKCPICYESVHDKDLKSVITQATHDYKVGETITMRLMKRQKGTTYALPKALWEKRADGVLSSMTDSSEKVAFMKLLTASKEDVRKNVLEVERSMLQRQLDEAEVSEIPFIESAFQALKERETDLNTKDKAEKEVNQMITSATKNMLKDQNEAKNMLQDKNEENGITMSGSGLTAGMSADGTKKIKQYASAFSDDEDETEYDENTNTGTQDLPSAEGIDSPAGNSESVVQLPSTEGMSIPEKKDVPNSDLGGFGSPDDPRKTPPVNIPEDTMPVEEAAENLELPSSSYTDTKTGHSEDAFYYYQAADGQQIYLHALNARCLVKEYGGLEYSPDTVTADIVEIENIFMSEDLRKRLRYLGHLPLTCEFQVVELALKEPVLSRNTIRCFTDEIDRRRKFRQKKRREEKRWARQVQEVENKRMGIKPLDSVIVRSQFMVQSDNRPVSPAARSDDSSLSASSSLVSPVGSPDIQIIESTTGDHDDEGLQTSSLSFAQMLKGGSSRTVWPKVNKPTSVSDEPSATARKTGSDDSDPEDKVPVPLYSHSFGDAIQTALDEHAKSKDEGNTMVSLTQMKYGGKKKKKQQKLLFTTSMARGGN